MYKECRFKEEYGLNENQKGIFAKIQQEADISPNEIIEVAESVKHADFSDETTVRQLVRSLSKMVNKPISREKEEQIIDTICNQKGPTDLQSLTQYFK